MLLQAWTNLFFFFFFSSGWGKRSAHFYVYTHVTDVNWTKFRAILELLINNITQFSENVLQLIRELMAQRMALYYYWTVHHFGPEWNILATIWWIAMEFCTDMHLVHWMNLNYFFQISKQVLDGLLWDLVNTFRVPRRKNVIKQRSSNYFGLSLNLCKANDISLCVIC